MEERIKRALEELPQPILNDVEGSSQYRLFVLQNLLQDVLQSLEDQVNYFIKERKNERLNSIKSY